MLGDGGTITLSFILCEVQVGVLMYRIVTKICTNLTFSAAAREMGLRETVIINRRAF